MAPCRVAAAYRDRAVVPVTIIVETGPHFTLRRIEVVDLDDGQAVFRPKSCRPGSSRLEPGDPARAADLRAANARLVDYFRGQSYPLVKAPLPRPIVDHATLTMDVTFAVDPGPKAGFGEVSLTGPESFDPAIVRSFIYLEPGQPYSPKALADTRRSITSIPAVGSIRIREAEKLDAHGNLPIFIDVGDRNSQSDRLYRGLFECGWTDRQTPITRTATFSVVPRACISAAIFSTRHRSMA